MIFRRLEHWRDERNKLSQLSFEIEHIRAQYQGVIADAKAKSQAAYQSAISEMYSQTQVYEYEFDRITTDKWLRKARERGIPIPDRPKAYEENDYWEWSPFQIHTLTVNGQMFLRREVAHEREIADKPVLMWLAICISFLSLSVSTLSAIFR
jgi:hypothetical protein